MDQLFVKMARLSVLVLLAVVLLIHDVDGSTPMRRVCYFTNWTVYRPSGGTYTVGNVDPSLCSHINFAFARIVDTELKPYEALDDVPGGYWEQFNNLKIRAPELKTLLSVGGFTHGPRPFTYVVSTQQTRADFIANTISLLRRYNFDGIDFDWEYPGQFEASDKPNFSLLLKEFREAVEAESTSSGRPALLLTAAVTAGIERAVTSYEVPALNQYLDFINLMTYDYNGPWSNATGLTSALRGVQGDQLTMEATIDWYLAEGAYPDKLVVGLPAFGHAWSLADSNQAQIGALGFPGLMGPYTRSQGFLAYYEICSYLQRGMKATFDTLGSTMYGVMGSEWVSYDNTQTFGLKLDYIVSRGLGGAMMWALDEDDFTGNFCGEGRYPLLSVINSKLKNTTIITTTETTGMTTTSTTIPSTTSSTTVSNSEKPFVCQTSFGFFADSSDCAKYIVCYGGKPLIELRCQINYNFNPQNQKCEKDFTC